MSASAVHQTLHRALDLHNQGKLLEARKAYKVILDQYPDHADALHFLGVIAIQNGDLERAERLIGKSIRAAPDNAVAHSNLGHAVLQRRRYAAAVEHFDRAIALDPLNPVSHYNRANALIGLDRLDEGLAGFDEAITLNPDYASARFNKSLPLLKLGRMSEGWRLYEVRKTKPDPVVTRHFPQPLWLGDRDLRDQTLFIHWEQGLGDTLQFIRYARLARTRGARVIASVQAPLLRLIKQLEPEIEIIGANAWPAVFNLHCSMMSLPLAFGTTLETIPAESPYLRADTAGARAWSSRLQDAAGLRVGLVWAGASTPVSGAPGVPDERRSIALKHLAPLLATPGVSFVSLQKGSAANQLFDLAPRARPLDLMDEVNDFADTAALVANLDLVISVDTSVVHLAGAMAKPVWILSRLDGCWRWLTGREDSPWYPTARLFQQREPGEWGPVIAEVAARLAEVVAGRMAPVWPLSRT
jgi:tetratricopeptide (TPR) repeat protein